MTQSTTLQNFKENLFTDIQDELEIDSPIEVRLLSYNVHIPDERPSFISGFIYEDMDTAVDMIAEALPDSYAYTFSTNGLIISYNKDKRYLLTFENVTIKLSDSFDFGDS